MTPAFSWERCTVLRGPVLIGTYPITVAFECWAWGDGGTTVLEGQWSCRHGRIWTIHAVEDAWYAVPSLHIRPRQHQWPLQLHSLGVQVQQWPIRAGWRPHEGDRFGVMAVTSHRQRSPVYWCQIGTPGLRGEDRSRLVHVPALDARPPSRWQRIREWAGV